MKLVIEVLTRSLKNLEAETSNIEATIAELDNEIKERRQDLYLIAVKSQELKQAISILEGTKTNAITSKNKKTKSSSNNS